MVIKYTATEAEILLGKRIENLRIIRGMSCMDLSRKIKKRENIIKKYEAGEIVPLSILEKIAKILESPIQKRTIRRLSILRNLQELTDIEQQELINIYSDLLQDEEEFQYE